MPLSCIRPMRLNLFVNAWTGRDLCIWPVTGITWMPMVFQARIEKRCVLDTDLTNQIRSCSRLGRFAHTSDLWGW